MGSSVTVEKLNAFTNLHGVVDFVASRTASVPASPVGRHGAFVLPSGLGGAGRSSREEGSGSNTILFDSFYFSSAGGAVLNALAEGDVVSGPLWDGNLEVLDSATATVHASFYCIEGGGLVVARMQPDSPVPAAAGPGFLGFITMIAASNEYDVFALNSSSVTAGDFYSECAVLLQK
jgi:hypothetical protein